MTDRLHVRHPDHPELNGYVTQAAFDALWSKKGYVADEVTPAPTEDDLNAELDRRAGIEPEGETEPVPESPDEEKARLTAQLEAASVQVDRRWGLKRLRIEAANLGDPA